MLPGRSASLWERNTLHMRKRKGSLRPNRIVRPRTPPTCSPKPYPPRTFFATAARSWACNAHRLHRAIDIPQSPTSTHSPVQHHNRKPSGFSRSAAKETQTTAAAPSAPGTTPTTTYGPPLPSILRPTTQPAQPTSSAPRPHHSTSRALPPGKVFFFQVDQHRPMDLIFAS